MQMRTDMSSPIHDHYHFASPRHTTSASDSEKSGLGNNSEERSSSILLNDLPSPPLAAAMFSLQLMADAVNRALHQCTTAQQPKTASMTQIDFSPNHAPSFCYFFIDMQQEPESDYQYSDFEMDPYQNFTTVSDKQQTRDSTATTKTDKLQRQRSISECSEDSFICFEEDTESIDSSAYDCTDCNPADKTTDISADSQGLRKKVRFNLKPEIHVMHTWDFAYRAARKGGWQAAALDRERFRQRIQRIAPTLNIILTSNHRDKVYKDRFLSIK